MAGCVAIGLYYNIIGIQGKSEEKENRKLKDEIYTGTERVMYEYHVTRNIAIYIHSMQSSARAEE